MSTENEEWRENSFNEENTGAGRDGNRSYNREGGERPYRPSYNREGGDRPYRRDLMPTMKEANVRNVLTTAKVVTARIVLASIVVKVEAIAATTVVAIVRDSIMTVRAVTVLVHVPGL